MSIASHRKAKEKEEEEEMFLKKMLLKSYELIETARHAYCTSLSVLYEIIYLKRNDNF